MVVVHSCSHCAATAAAIDIVIDIAIAIIRGYWSEVVVGSEYFILSSRTRLDEADGMGWDGMMDIGHVVGSVLFCSVLFMYPV